MSLGFPPPSGPSFLGPSWPPAAPTPDLSDRQLEQLPPPVLSPTPVVYPPPAYAAAPRPPLGSRPGVVGLACNLAATASLLWICALSLAWVTATAGADRLAADGENGPIFHILNRFDDRMVSGLAWPLYLFPAAAFVTGLLLLSQQRWARNLHTALGVVVLAWTAWWLQDNLLWWVSSGLYIAVACLLLWTPSARRWYAQRPA